MSRVKIELGMAMEFQKYKNISYGFRGSTAVIRLYSRVSFLYYNAQK
jgi:hypothetical protein